MTCVLPLPQANTLEQLRTADGINSRAAADAQRLLLEAQRYSWMTNSERKVLLQGVRQALPLGYAELMADAALAATQSPPTPSPPPPPPLFDARRVASPDAAPRPPPTPVPAAPAPAAAAGAESLPAPPAGDTLWKAPSATWDQQSAAPFQPPLQFTKLVPIVFDLETSGAPALFWGGGVT